MTSTTPFPSPAARRRRNREEVRQAILEASRDVMREKGVAALSLREVARRVNLQAPSLYAYFPNKMALYDALFLMGVRLRSAYRDREEAEREGFWDRLEGRSVSYMRFAQENPDLYQLAFERPVPGFVPSPQSLAEAFQAPAGLDRLLDEGIAAGEVVLNVPVAHARDLLVAMIHGLAAHHLANEPDLPVGSGRFGGQIPAAIALFRNAWDPRAPGSSGTGAGGQRKEDSQHAMEPEETRPRPR